MTTLTNSHPEQYNQTDQKEINHNYLTEQFADRDVILQKIKAVVTKGDFTLGQAVDDFEVRFARIVGTKHAIGVGSGTDALFLSKGFGCGAWR